MMCLHLSLCCRVAAAHALANSRLDCYHVLYVVLPLGPVQKAQRVSIAVARLQVAALGLQRVMPC